MELKAPFGALDYTEEGKAFSPVSSAIAKWFKSPKLTLDSRFRPCSSISAEDAQHRALRRSVILGDTKRCR